MILKHITHTYRFVPYGNQFGPKKGTLVLDVGMIPIAGIIDSPQDVSSLSHLEIMDTILKFSQS